VHRHRPVDEGEFYNLPQCNRRAALQSALFPLGRSVRRWRRWSRILPLGRGRWRQWIEDAANPLTESPPSLAQSLTQFRQSPHPEKQKQNDGQQDKVPRLK